MEGIVAGDGRHCGWSWEPWWSRGWEDSVERQAELSPFMESLEGHGKDCGCY